MLSTNRAALVRNILVLVLIGALSFYFLNTSIPKSEFIEDSIESVEDSKDTVMRFSAAILSASVAITLLPDDVATPLADSLADMNIYFVAILMILFFEKILIVYGFKLAAVVLPIACVIYALSILLKRDALKSLAVRLSILVLAVALVVPCSTHVTNYVAADLNQYVEETITATEDGADKINEAKNVGEDEKTVFEKLSESFRTAIDDISDLMLYFQNSIRKCINSIAILLMTNCLMPILNFFLLKWILREGFLARGDIELTVADYNAIEKDLRTRLEDKFDTAANGQKADDIALRMVKEVYEPIVKAIDRRYDVVVEFK